MREFIKRQHRHIWIALLAILFNALAPSISHALAWAGSAPYPSDICSASAAPSPAQKAPAPASLSMKHCVMCTVHGSADGLLPAVPPSLPALHAAAPAETPAPSSHAARPYWRRAAPRAPPITA